MDCPISGVFGAGKLFPEDHDPHHRECSVPEHIIGLSLPSWIENKIGRLVGFMALQNQTTTNTSSTLRPIATMSSFPNKSSLDVEVGSATSVQTDTAQLPNGCLKLIQPYTMRVSSMAILTRQRPLPVFHAIA